MAKRTPSMRTMSRFVVLAFGSTRESLAAEATLASAGITIKVMPLPPHRGRLCGIALRVRPDDESPAIEVLARRGIEVMARDEIEDY